MRARDSLAIASLSLVGLCAWVCFQLADDDADRRPAPLAPAAASLESSSRRAASDLADPPSVEPSTGAVHAADGAAARAQRSADYLITDPDTLVDVSGQVLDARTREPLAGMTIAFLSRRPRTCTVKTDEQGRFHTPAELAPGVVSVVHVADPESPRFAARHAIEPDEFLAAARTPGAARRELALVASSPERVLEAEVRGDGGAPAAGAEVTLTYGRREAGGEFVAQGRDYEVSDSDGRVRFSQFGADAYERSFRIEADLRGALTSDLVTLDPPIGTRPLRIDLHPGAALRVRARNDEGKPIANVSVWVAHHESGRFTSAHNGDTDAQGDCLFAPLRPGCYSVSVVHPLTGQTVQREIDLGRASEAAIDLRLSIAGLRLGLAGVVVDELGYPLPGVGLRVLPEGEAPVELETGEGGHFEYWGRPVASVGFSIGTGVMDDEYEPDALAVPFGVSGLRVRRTRSMSARTMPLVVADRATGAPVARASVMLYHGDAAAAAHGDQRYNTRAGVAQVAFKPRGDTLYCVDAPGYVRAEGSLAALCDAAAHTGVLRVELAPGFERRVEVRDRVSKRPLAGARFSEERRVVGTSDARGVVLLSSPEWPAGYRVECAGYRPLMWDPLASGFPGNVVWLDPERAEK
jgi:hypothetical protein